MSQVCCWVCQTTALPSAESDVRISCWLQAAPQPYLTSAWATSKPELWKLSGAESSCLQKAPSTRPITGFLIGEGPLAQPPGMPGMGSLTSSATRAGRRL